ncbi:MAG: hypothetical protein V1856_02550 [Candidatus Liptonbacteria bacterium]
MDQSLKQIIAIFFGIIILSIGFYGNFLPWAKSSSYVRASQEATSATSLEQLEKIIQPPLDMPSPIGQPELVRNLANSLMNVIRSNTDQELIDRCLKLMAKYYSPIIEWGKGMSFGQDLYIVGIIHETAAIQSQNAAYLDIAEQAFLTGVGESPNRPQHLYGLLDVYKMKQDGDRFKGVADKILENWPQDEKTRKLVEELVVAVPKDKK